MVLPGFPRGGRHHDDEADKPAPRLVQHPDVSAQFAESEEQQH